LDPLRLTPRPPETVTPAAASPLPAPAGQTGPAAGQPVTVDNQATTLAAGMTRRSQTGTFEPTANGQTTAPFDPKAAVAAIDKDLERRKDVNPAGYQAKVEALDGSAFKFFRGTAPQFYRELFRELKGAPLAQAPAVTLQGDVHAENFGTVRDGKGGFVLGMTDFDEATRGPASLDLVRGLASIIALAGDDKLALDAFLKGYGDGAAGNGQPTSALARKLLEKAPGRSNAKELDPADATKLADAGADRLSLADGKGKAVADALTGLPWLAGAPVTDVASDSKGTASADLFAFRAVVGDRIVELKEMLPGTLNQQLQDAGMTAGGGDALTRFQQAQQTYQGAGTLPASTVTIEGRTYLVRERPAEKSNVKSDKVLEASPADRAAYFQDLGRALGAAHGRGGDAAALSAFARDPATQKAMLDLATKLARQSGEAYTLFKERHPKAP
jgi:hypothetical protein